MALLLFFCQFSFSSFHEWLFWVGVQYQRRERVRICDPSEQFKQDQKQLFLTFLPSSSGLTMIAFLPALLPARRMTTLPFFILQVVRRLAEINQLYKQTLQQPAILSPDVAIAIKAQAYARDAKDCLGDENQLKIWGTAIVYSRRAGCRSIQI